ncbi:MAG: DNA gyrase/topoisomerase IV subunit A [Mangrovibacterium sp.]
MTEELQNEPTKLEQNEKITYLSGMYETWFLDYASYVILERAVPYVNDGLKPVQRRILHAMRSMDDGRYTKVANIIGQTMMYHPHGDASIGDALVQLGQKDLLIDTQGNWGNLLTGDGAAAPRYIEARLTKFALDVVFNPKTTEWKLSYDGRNKEPITLPVKFPLLLAQGVEGIAVGLASKILPHNFIELVDASIAHLKGKEFIIYPDFPTGGSADISRYNDGVRGGAVKVRAKIEKQDNKTLVITEVPFGKTTSSLIESIIKANDKGKIKIKHIDDNTSDKVEILVQLATGVSSDKTIDALYAFTDCEVSISPNSCVIDSDKPAFLGVSHILRRNTNQTVDLLQLELEIRRGELENQLHYASLEKIFIEERIYKDKEFEQAADMDAAVSHIDKRLAPWKPKLIREITRNDILKLMEIKMARILKFNSDKADNIIKGIQEEIKEINYNIEHIISFAISYYENIKAKYGKGRGRKTELRNFENIEATKVVVTNAKLYVDYEEGFMGTSLRKSEYICDCSDIDDIIIFRKDGTYFITRISEKAFIGKNILHVAVFKRNDKRTIYNVVYRNGKQGFYYMKRFAVTGVTRDKEYNLTKGEKGSKIHYFSANPNGEAEILKITLKPQARMKRMFFDLDFSTLAIKGRASMGNILSKVDIYRMTLKEKGVSTLGGRKIWFDKDILRLNSDGRGEFLGEFQGDDQIIAFYRNGDFQLYNFDLSNHFETDVEQLAKKVPGKILTVIFFDADQNYYYLKRFNADETLDKRVSFIGENEENRVLCISWAENPQFKIIFGGKNETRPAEEVDAANFIGVKSYKARGKRLSTYEIASIVETTPEEIGEDSDKEPEEDNSNEINNDVPFEVERPKDEGDKSSGQTSLFD